MKKMLFYSILFLPLILCILTSIISVQFLIEPWLREMWGDGIMVVSALLGLGVSKLWVKYLDQSGKSANILNYIEGALGGRF
jgi:hypothetical protein